MFVCKEFHEYYTANQVESIFKTKIINFIIRIDMPVLTPSEPMTDGIENVFPDHFEWNIDLITFGDIFIYLKII